MPGRLTPSSVLSIRVAAPTTAPVFPIETIEPASPIFTIATARAIDESGF